MPSSDFGFYVFAEEVIKNAITFSERDGALAALDGICGPSKFFKGECFEPCIPPRFFELSGSIEHREGFVCVANAEIMTASHVEGTPSIFGAFVDGGFDELLGVGRDRNRETDFFPLDMKNGGIVGGIGELEGKAFAVGDGCGGDVDFCDGVFGVVLGATCPCALVRAEKDSPDFFGGDGEEVVSSSFDRGGSEGHIAAELDLGAAVGSCAPDLAEGNERAPDLAAFDGGAVVGDADLGDADGLHDFGAWAGHREFEGLDGGSDQARSGKKAQCKGSTAKSGS